MSAILTQVTRKQSCGQEKRFTVAPSGWRSSKDTLFSTFAPLLLPHAFVSAFLTCLSSRSSFISLISPDYKHLWISLSDILSISQIMLEQGSDPLPPIVSSCRVTYMINPPFISHDADQALLSNSTAFIENLGSPPDHSVPLIWAEMTRLCGPSAPGLLCHHRQNMTRSLSVYIDPLNPMTSNLPG